MLTSALIHPPLLNALANCGHGSQILIADGNFPYATVIGPNATVVHLNLRPGMLTVDEGVAVATPAVSRAPERLQTTENGA